MMQWETVIGLEIHAQLATQSKLFSGAATRYGQPPNRQASAIDLGLPGVLPVLNAEAVRMAIKFGLAIGAEIPQRSVFARKNYFYPDLPKGYQISQFEAPIVGRGQIDIELEDGGHKRIGVTRAHLEEDAGKSVHEGFGHFSGIDLNRAGTPLLEIVSEPELRSAREAVAYMRKVHAILRYLEICDGNMQEGSFRCDANVSIRPAGQQAFGIRTELKNINSFRFVAEAIDHESARQIEVLEAGGEIIQETRLYDPHKNTTRAMRGKEEANDYRYFPEPDLPALTIEPALLDEIRAQLPELPDARKQRFMRDYQLPEQDSIALTLHKETADYFEACARAAGHEARLSANWINGELAANLKRENKAISESPVNAQMLGGLIWRIKDGAISGKIAKQVFAAMWQGEGDADAIIKNKGLKQLTDTDAIEKLADEIIAANPDQLKQYQTSPPEKQARLIGYFVGQAMKKSQGKASPRQVNEVLRVKLKG